MTKPHERHFAPLASKDHQRRLDMPRSGNFKALLLSLALLPAGAFAITAQAPPRPKFFVPNTHQEQRTADRTRLYCAGYIRNQTLPHMPEIVGAVEEQEQRR